MKKLAVFIRRFILRSFSVVGSFSAVGIIFLSFTFCDVFGQAGVLDSTFGGDGIVLTEFEGGYANRAFAVTSQPDGKTIAVGISQTDYGIDFALARYNPDGLLDDSFGVDGKVITDFGIKSIDRANSVALQSDGKIVVAGSTGFFTDYYYYYSDLSKFALARYNTDGTLDTSFGINGKVTTIIDDLSSASSIKIQSDGKLIVVGFSTLSQYGYDYDYRFTIVRYNSDGSLDESFGVGGIVKTSITPFNNFAESVAIQPDGKIVVGGWIENLNSDFTVVRYNTNGSLDSNFSDDGIVSIDLVSNDQANSIALQTDGKILLSGGISYDWTNADFATIRLDTNGLLDSTFGVNGKVITSIGSYTDFAESVVVQSDEKILVAGWTATKLNSPPTDFSLVRYNNDGTLDLSFNSNGIVTTEFGKGQARIYEITIQGDGKIIATGTAWDSATSSYQFALVRYLNDLTLGEISFTSLITSPLIYPNPIQSTEVLQYTLTKDELLTLSLYDVNGRLVKNFFTQQKRIAGEHKEELSIGNIAAGNYLLTLNNGLGNVNVKVVKQ